MFILILLFIIGLVFGSFGSVLLTRLGEKVNRKTLSLVVFGHSECPSCKRQLKPKYLIPVISFLLQRGRCAFCAKKISRKYIALELGSGAIFVLTYIFLQQFNLGGRGITVFWIAINWLLFLLIIFDIEKLELHVPVWFILLLLIIIPQIFTIIGYGFGNILRAIIASLMFGVFFYILYFAAKRYVRKRYKTDHEGIGEGDAMLAFVLGATVPLVFNIHHIQLSVINLLEIFTIFLVLSSLIGLILTLIQTLFGNKKIHIGNKRAVVMPFIPAMIIAFWILLYSSSNIILFAFPSLW